MKILICDNEQTYLNTLQIHIEEYMMSRHIPCVITALTDPTRIQKDTEVFDLAFLDIQMPGIYTGTSRSISSKAKSVEMGSISGAV